MIANLIILYLTIFISFQWGQRIAMTPIDYRIFFILILCIWMFLKSIA